MTWKEQLAEQAKEAGLFIRSYSPSDGITRYRFFEKGMEPEVEETQTYFGPKNGIYTALGINEAEAFLGFHYSK